MKVGYFHRLLTVIHFRVETSEPFPDDIPKIVTIGLPDRITHVLLKALVLHPFG